jgi:hypothetical protein
MDLMYRYSRVRQAEIGEVLGNLDYAAVSRERKRLRERIENDRNISSVIGKD